MTTLYGIWYADYSNSSVDHRVFTSREDALAVCRASRDGRGSLLEFELDVALNSEESVKRLIRPGESVFWVGMRPDGNEAQAIEHESSTTPDERLRGRLRSGVVDWMVTEMWAEDEQHAIKIANERRSRWLADGARLDGETDHWGLVLVAA